MLLMRHVQGGGRGRALVAIVVALVWHVSPALEMVGCFHGYARFHRCPNNLIFQS